MQLAIRNPLIRSLLSTAALAVLAGLPATSDAGSLFLTGHDPDFHATLGGNTAGAIKINQVAIGFVQDPAFNPFYAGTPKFLFVESRIAPPGGHTVGKAGIVASGYVEGVNFDHADATQLNAALNNLGTVYSAIVVASDFGGLLTQAELNILNSRNADIIAFLNAGGGIYCLAEGNGGVGLTPGGGWLAFLPIAAVSPAIDQSEVGNTVTAYGAGLGLTNADVNGNASHTIFTAYGTLSPVDLDAAGRVLTVAGHDAIIAVESSTWSRIKKLAGN
ncbi:MAG TPA: hypothetical protein VF720_12220 [Candidatus Eisenbacteria bacterium]